MSDGENEVTRYTGRVKWFNKRSGYGFVTVTDRDRVGEDVFVHHSGLHVAVEQYRYLVQGEYVSFDVRETEGDKYKWQAWGVRGVHEGMLMCETQQQMREARESRDESGDGEQTQNRGRGQRYRGGGPRGGSGDGDGEWVLKRPSNGKGRSNGRSRQNNDNNSS